MNKNMSIQVLKTVLDSLSSAFQSSLPKQILDIREKDFKQLSQSEAYAIINFLLNFCSEGIKIKTPEINVWKKTDFESKIIIEKFKKNVLKVIKNLSLKRKVYIPVLRASELILPNCPRFFECCLAISDYCLSNLLQSSASTIKGIDCWNSSPDVLKNVILLQYEEINSLNKELYSASEILVGMKRELILLKEKKEELIINAKAMVENFNPEFKSCILDYLTTMNTENIIKHSKKVDELHKENVNKLMKLRKFQNSLQFLKQLSENNDSHERSGIDGKKLLFLIPHETHEFAKKEGVSIIDNEGLNLQGMITVLHKTVSYHVKTKFPDFSECLQIQLPAFSGNKLLFELNKKEEVLQHQIKKQKIIGVPCGKQKSSSNVIDQEEINKWIKENFIQINEICFKGRNEYTMPSPIADIKRIEKRIKIREYKNKLKECSVQPVSSSPVLGFRRRRRSKSLERCLFSHQEYSICTSLNPQRSKDLLPTCVLREAELSIGSDSSTVSSKSRSTLGTHISRNMSTRIIRESGFSIKSDSSPFSSANSTPNFRCATSSTTVPDLVLDGEICPSPILNVTQIESPNKHLLKIQRRSSSCSSLNLVDLSGPILMEDYNTTNSTKPNETFDFSNCEFPDITLESSFHSD